MHNLVLKFYMNCLIARVASERVFISLVSFPKIFSNIAN